MNDDDIEKLIQSQPCVSCDTLSGIVVGYPRRLVCDLCLMFIAWIDPPSASDIDAWRYLRPSAEQVRWFKDRGLTVPYDRGTAADIIGGRK